VPFIGRATGEKLKYIVKTIEEFRTLPFRRVHEILGKNGTDLWLELNGVDIMSFANPDTPKSISRTRSFNDTICSDKEFLWEKILINLERSYKDLMTHNLETRCITLYLRDKELRRYVYPFHFSERTADRRVILAKVRELFNEMYDPSILYRSTGVIFSDFRETKPKQLSLLQTENTSSENTRNSLIMKSRKTEEMSKDGWNR